VLYTKTRRAHWNVEGPDFHSQHLFFEPSTTNWTMSWTALPNASAPWVTTLPLTLKDFLQLTHLNRTSPREKRRPKAFFASSSPINETVIITLRENINRFANEYGDAGTSDYITASWKS